MKWFCIFSSFVFVLLVSSCGAEKAFAQEDVTPVMRGSYGTMCPLDMDAFLAKKNFREVDAWINADGMHRWVMHENETHWLLTMHNAMTQAHCAFDIGELEHKES